MGWAWGEAFAILDDNGIKLQMANMGPRLVQRNLTQAWQRFVERRLASKVWEQRERIVVGHVKQALASKQNSSKEREDYGHPGAS